MEHSTFILEIDDDLSRDDFQQEAAENRQTPEVKELIDELKRIKTFPEFRTYMHKIVSNRLPSPVYSFSAEEKNTDNSWWTGGNKKYELLKTINEYVVTINAQEDGGITQLYSDTLHMNHQRQVMFECPLLSFLFPKSKLDHLKLNLELQNLKGRKNYRYSITDQDATHGVRIPMRTYVTFDSMNAIIKVEYDGISMETNSQNTFSRTVNDFLNEIHIGTNEEYVSKELRDILTNDFVVCEVMDMNFMSPEKKHGLFTSLLQLFKQMNM